MLFSGRDFLRYNTPFLDVEGKPYLEVHHIKWLSKGGADSIENAIALCPNCHSKMHVIDDPTDVAFLLEKAQNNRIKK